MSKKVKWVRPIKFEIGNLNKLYKLVFTFA